KLTGIVKAINQNGPRIGSFPFNEHNYHISPLQQYQWLKELQDLWKIE
ncbi:9817_t:CDS:1, partial [Acaulospora colombiana]